jgi:hypothetical protein
VLRDVLGPSAMPSGDEGAGLGPRRCTRQMTASGKCCGCARLAKDVDMTPRSDAEAPHREQGGFVINGVGVLNHVYRIIQVAGSSQNSLVGSIAVVSRSPRSSAGPLRAHSLVVSSKRDC